MQQNRNFLYIGKIQENQSNTSNWSYLLNCCLKNLSYCHFRKSCPHIRDIPIRNRKSHTKLRRWIAFGNNTLCLYRSIACLNPSTLRNILARYRDRMCDWEIGGRIEINIRRVRNRYRFWLCFHLRSTLSQCCFLYCFSFSRLQWDLPLKIFRRDFDQLDSYYEMAEHQFLCFVSTSYLHKL